MGDVGNVAKPSQKFKNFRRMFQPEPVRNPKS